MRAWFKKASEFVFGRHQSRLADPEQSPEEFLPAEPSNGESDASAGNMRPVSATQGNGDQKPASPPVVNAAAVVARILPSLAKLLDRYHRSFSAWLAGTIREQQATIEKQIQSGSAKLSDDLLRHFDQHCQDQKATLERGLLPLSERIAEAARKDSEPHWMSLRKDLIEACSTGTQCAALKPLVDQLLALFDRIHSEKSFLGEWYRKDHELSLHLGARQLQEQSQGAIGSFATELLVILRSVGVEMIEGVGGPINPQFQKVVGVEPAPRPELDGHVARVVRAGFAWNGILIRFENVVAYKKGAQKS